MSETPKQARGIVRIDTRRGGRRYVVADPDGRFFAVTLIEPGWPLYSVTHKTTGRAAGFYVEKKRAVEAWKRLEVVAATHPRLAASAARQIKLLKRKKHPFIDALKRAAHGQQPKWKPR